MLEDINSYVDKIIGNDDYSNLKLLFEELIEKFTSDIEKIEIEFIMYERFNYKYVNDENNLDESTEEKVKRKDNKFKEEVKKYYKNCIVTGTSQKICQVAHIKPFSESDPEEKYDPNNGLLLRSDIHDLFDKKLLTINPETFELQLKNEVLSDEEFKDYLQYNGKILRIKLESKKYLKIYS